MAPPPHLVFLILSWAIEGQNILPQSSLVLRLVAARDDIMHERRQTALRPLPCFYRHRYLDEITDPIDLCRS